MLEEEWKGINCEPQVERVVPVYKKKGVLSLKTFF
jgi:hypothetical protein